MRRCKLISTLGLLGTSMVFGYLVMNTSSKVFILRKNEFIHPIINNDVEQIISYYNLPKREAEPIGKTYETLQSNIIHTDLDHDPDTVTTIDERFHVILTFRRIEDSWFDFFGSRQARMREYMWTLGQFLKNDKVKQVHLMVDSPDMSEYIQKNVGLNPKLMSYDSPKRHSGQKLNNFQNGIPHPKLKFHQVVSPDMVLTLHQFAFTHFQGELVVITQADIILGEGFEKVNRTLLAGNRLLYSLSRHESKCGTLKDQCEKYSGSHDTFVFVPDGTLSQKARDLLYHPVFSYGTENLVMYVYQHLLNYRILNPCRILRTYHYHCTNFRKYKKPQKWVNELDERSKPVDRLI